MMFLGQFGPSLGLFLFLVTFALYARHFLTISVTKQFDDIGEDVHRKQQHTTSVRPYDPRT